MENRTKLWGGIVAVTLIVLYFASLIVFVNQQNAHTAAVELRTKENSTYLRFTSCVLSVPIADRDQTDIEKCYDIAEGLTGTQVDHFSNGNKE